MFCRRTARLLRLTATERLRDVEQSALDLRRGAEAALLAERDGDAVEGVGDVGVLVGAVDRAQHVVGFAVGGLGVGVAGLLPPEGAQAHEAAPNLGGGARQLAALLDALHEEGFGAIELAEFAVNASDHLLQLGLHGGLVAERVGALDAAGEQLAGGHLHAARLGGAARLEEVHQETGHGLRLRQLSFGLASGGLGASLCRASHLGLPERSSQPHNQRYEHRHRRRHAPPVPSHKPPGAIRERVGPGLHRATVEVTAHVLDELLRRRVAALRLAAQRLHHDRVEVAAKGAAQARLGGAARLGRVGPDRGRRRTGVFFQYEPLDFMRRGGVIAMRTASGQHLVQHHAQGVHVGGGRDALPADLLGRGVARRHRSRAGLREARRVGIEHLGDAEVQQLHLTRRRDVHVRRLQVAMHDEVSMRVGDRSGGGGKEVEPLVDR